MFAKCNYFAFRPETSATKSTFRCVRVPIKLANFNGFGGGQETKIKQCRLV